MNIYYQTTSVPVTVISENLKTLYMKLLIWKVSPSLGLDIRNILKFSINSANISYLFLTELILGWPIITVLGSRKRWVLMLARSLAGCLNKFEKPKQDVSFKKGELAMLLRLSFFLCKFQTVKLFIKS